MDKQRCEDMSEEVIDVFEAAIQHLNVGLSHSLAENKAEETEIKCLSEIRPVLFFFFPPSSSVAE